MLLLTSCAMFKHEVERSLNKDIKEHMDKNFNSYATNWAKEKWEARRTKFLTGVGIVSGTLGVVATTLGIITVYRKLKRKKDED